MSRSPSLASLFVLLALTLADTAFAFEKDSLVWKKCTGCHPSENGHIARIEEIRTTPEEWTVIVDRMHRLYHMRMAPGEMATILKELCATQILEPAEAARVAYISLFNNPQTMESPVGSEEEHLFETCVRCHSAAKILSYRMTESAWAKLRDFHLYIDPTVMYQMREMHWRSEADTALRYLARDYPYHRAWSTPQAKPAGAWFVLGNEPGKGSYRGHARLTETGEDEYLLEGALEFSDGTAETFTGEATIYGGYALRTRTHHNGDQTMGAFDFVDGIIRGEHHHAAPDFRTSSSTWYPETQKSQVLRVTPGYLLNREEARILIEGQNLPKVSASDIDPGSADVDVLRAETLSPEAIEVILVYRATGHQNTHLGIRGVDAPSSRPNLNLAPRIDYLKVDPAMGRARVNGGVNYPAEGVQFQALAYSSGADADDPLDDYLLGPVPAGFSLAEEVTRPGDDDLRYLGAIEADGTYLPSGDYNPIPARDYGSEATGMVKVIANYVRGPDSYVAEGRLVVTVPDFIQRIR